MKQIDYFLFFVLVAGLVSCSTGYQKENGEWVWISYNEAIGKGVTRIDSVDSEHFQVLSNEDYGRDKTHVFFQTEIIKGAEPGTFEVITENGYARDSHNVFLDYDKVVFADPATFEVLEFPYSKDANRVFCGTIPMDIDTNEVREFKVTNEDKLMSGMKSSTLLSYFIEVNPDYQWLDTLGIDGVIVGAYATGETRTRKFRGFREIK